MVYSSILAADLFDACDAFEEYGETEEEHGVTVYIGSGWRVELVHL